MLYLIVLAIALVLFVAAALIRSRASRAGSSLPSTPVLTRAQLAERLRQLEELPAPPEVPHALCYSMAVQVVTVDYVCPKDLTRTRYPQGTATAARIELLPRLTAIVEAYAGLQAALDASEFCSACEPQRPTEPQVALTVKLPDGAVRRTRGVDLGDVRLLEAFLADEPTYLDGQDAEVPVAKVIPRIRALLGLHGPDAPE
jgi:hypothetical protein